MNTIITIGRQYGSGGKEIGKKLAEYYNIPFYDKELLKVAAKAVSARRCLKTSMRNQPQVFSTPS